MVRTRTIDNNLNPTWDQTFHVLVDGEAPGAAHGLDIDKRGRGTLVEPRLYQLIRQPGSIDDRTFEIAFDAPGVEAYAFTFG